MSVGKLPSLRKLTDPTDEMKANDWERELASYKKQFVDSQGWNEKQEANYVRDAWACPA